MSHCLFFSLASSACALHASRTIAPRSSAQASAARMALASGESCTGERVCIVGATGYIGKAVVRESVRRGYPTTAVVRDASKAASEPKFEGAKIVQLEVSDAASLVREGAPFH